MQKRQFDWGSRLPKNNGDAQKVKTWLKIQPNSVQ